MNYQKKYLYYKKKYLELKNQTGGNTLILSGPSAIYYYKHTKLNKKIIILGDIHNSFEGICNDKNSIDIITYLKNLFQTKIKLDLFIEADIPDKYQLLHGLNKKQLFDKSSDFITGVIEFSIDNYKKEKSKRIHFTDIRNNILGFKEFKQFDNVIKFLYNVETFKKDTNLFDFYMEYNNYINRSIFIIFEYIRDFMKDNGIKLEYNPNLPDIFVKEINKSHPNILKKLFPITLKYIVNYLDIITDEELKINNLDEINDIYKKCMLAIAAINDIYTVLRILKNDDIINCILYVGKAHCHIFYEYLTALEFDMTKYQLSKETSIRCLPNIEDFESFFK